MGSVEVTGTNAACVAAVNAIKSSTNTTVELSQISNFQTYAKSILSSGGKYAGNLHIVARGRAGPLHALSSIQIEVVQLSNQGDVQTGNTTTRLSVT